MKLAKRGITLRALAIVLPLLTGAGGGLARANSELPISSIYDGKTPYLVVVDDEGSSQRAPGIYVPDREGKFRPFLAGRVLTGGPMQGVLHQFSITQLNRRYASLSVVNGKLYLYELNPEKADPPVSIYELGGQEHPLYDVNGAPVTLPEITSPTDIEIASLPHDRQHQVFAVSVRVPGHPVNGDGITFVLTLNAGSEEGQQLIEQTPVVIDYKFQSYTNLLSLFVNEASSEAKIFSRLLLQSLLPKRGRPDTAALSAWKDRIRVLLGKLDAGEKLTLKDDVPVFEVPSSTNAVGHFPYLWVQESGWAGVSIAQVYDPFTGQDGLALGVDPKSVRESSQLAAYGRVNIDPANNKPYFYSNARNQGSSLLFLQGELYLLLGREVTGGSQPYLLKLAGSAEALPERLGYNFVTPRDQAKGAADKSYLFVSSIREGRKLTEVFVISRTGAAFELTRRMPVAEEFYDPEEMFARVEHLGSGRDAEVLFDTLTPPQATQSVYQQVLRPTIPYFNVSRTIAPTQRTVQTYLKSLEEKQLEQRVRYDRYDRDGATEEQSGISIFDAKGKLAHRLTGELVEREGQSTHRGVLASKNVELSNKGIRGRITVAALDAGFQQGAHSFSLATVFTPENTEDEAVFEPEMLQQNIALPFSQLRGLQIVPGLKRQKGQFTMLLFIDEPEAGAETPPSFLRPRGRHAGLHPGVYAYTFRTGLSPGDAGGRRLSLSDPKLTPLSDGPVSAQEISSRVRFDAEGAPYWVNTPEVHEADKGYSVTSFASGQPTLPNRAQRHQIKWLPANETQQALGLLPSDRDGSEEYGYGFQGAGLGWAVHSARDIAAKLGTIEAGGDDEKMFEMIRSYFPGLEAKLDALVDNGGRKTIFVVPQKLKDPFVRMMRAHWEKMDGKVASWNIRNRKAMFSVVDGTGQESQRDILRQFAGLREHKGFRHVFFAEMGSLLRMGRGTTEEGETPFLLQDAELEPEGVMPHMLYLLASEGRTLDLPAFRARLQGPQDTSVAIVATPDELKKAKEEAPLEMAQGLLSAYQQDTDYLWSEWRVLPPSVSGASSEIKKARGQNITALEREVFPDLIETLEELADPTKPPRHRVLLVPDELRPLVQKLILSRWAAGRGPVEAWDYRNSKMFLFRFGQTPANDPPALSQGLLLNNLDVMRDVAESGRRPFLLGNLSDLRKTGRILSQNEGKRFTISDWADDGDMGLGEEASEAPKTQAPHALYLLATEGRRIQPQEFVAEQAAPPLRSSMFFLGSPQDWEGIMRDVASFEERFKLSERFEVTELLPPSPERRKALMTRVASAPQIRSLNYRYDAGGLGRNTPAAAAATASSEESLGKLMGYLVNRGETLAKEFKKEVTSEFIRVMSEFSRALVEDAHLRNTLKVDRPFLERLLSRVFPIPMNLNTLPPDDWMRRLAREDAPLLMQSAGYGGPLDLKAQVIRTVLAMTRTDPVATVPGSIIVYGATRSGKTLLFRTLIKMLGLKEFDFANPKDENAGAIIINVGALSSDEKTPEDGERMYVKRALQYLDHFLTLPNGYRGWILFDDIHKGDENVIKEIITWQQSLFDAPGGMFKAKSIDGVTREIPVRNLVPWMTLNPTQDQDKIKRFKSKGDDEELIIATLAGSKFQVERSFLQRWGLLLNLNKFPAEAKAPKLLESLRAGARNDFNVKGQLTLVSPQSVKALVQKFPDANASEFLSGATSQLLSMPDRIRSAGSLFVVAPGSSVLARGGGGSTGTGTGEAWHTSKLGNQIEDAIRAAAVPTSVDQRYDGKLQFLSISLDALRTDLYESVISTLTQDPRFAGGMRQQRYLLAPLLRAAVSNLTIQPNISLRALNLDPFDFGASTPVQQREFRRVLDQLAGGGGRYFPVRFGDEFSREGVFAQLTDHNHRTNEQRGRAHVLAEYSGKVQELLAPYAASLARVDNLDLLPTPEAWLRGLTEQDPAGASQRIGEALTELYFDFMTDMHAPGLAESIHPEKFQTLTSYDEARFFLMVIDRAITKLPWGRMNRLITTALIRAASDMDLGQRPGVQSYLFTSEKSLVRPATHELALQMSLTSQAYKTWTDEEQGRAEASFKADCEKMLLQEN